MEGEGISYGSWKSGHGSEGDAAEETSQSFTIPFDGGKPVVREIVLNYALDEDEKAEFDRLYDAMMQTYDITDKQESRSFFNQLRQEFLDWHGTEFETPEFEQQEQKITDLYMSKAIDQEV